MTKADAMPTTQIEIPLSGSALRDAGIQAAHDHAEAINPGWADQAMGFILQYPNNEFMGEQVREYAHSHGLPEPPHLRSWGSVFVAAKKRGLIVQIGYGQVKTATSHRANAAIWRRV